MRILAIASLAALLLAAGCKTAESESEPAASPVTQGAGMEQSLPLTQDDSQNVYLKLLGVELASGVQVPKEQLHTSRALLECRRDGPLAPCTFRVRLAAGELSASQPVSPDLATKVWSFVKTSRPDLAGENKANVDLVCDYIGKKSPPFTTEGVNCSATLARLPTEAVFDDKLSEELTDALRGSAPLGGKVVTLNGVVSCQWLAGTPRTPCVVRAFADGGVLQEHLTELASDGASTTARLLQQAVSDATPGSKAQEAPHEISAALICQVDSTQVTTSGKRMFVCRARI